MGTGLGLYPQAQIGEALVAFARDTLAEAERALGNGRSGAAAVHDFRKAMKRWRALLRLLEPALGPAADLRDEARDLARALSAARDRQSALDAVTDLEKTEDGLPARSLTTIRQRLETLREATESTALTDAMRDRIKTVLAAADDAMDRWRHDQTRFADVADSLADAYRRARRAIPADWKEAGDEDLHRLRQRIIVHRYQMDLVGPLWPRLGKVWTGEAQRLRERLGTYQDLTVLARQAAPRQPLAPWRSRLTPLIAARQAVHVDAAAKLAARLFAEPPKAFRRRLVALWESAVPGD